MSRQRKVHPTVKKILGLYDDWAEGKFNVDERPAKRARRSERTPEEEVVLKTKMDKARECKKQHELLRMNRVLALFQKKYADRISAANSNPVQGCELPPNLVPDEEKPESKE